MAGSVAQADLAFDGAMGFGDGADGGRGGEIVKVTTLADSGEGSLRWALEQLDGPRIVVFEVSGTINLKDSIEVNGDVTIAGQTSPNGITVSGAKLRIMESDVIIRGMQFRPGDGEDGDIGSNRDGISIGSPKTTVENVIIDSCSFSWSVDELLTVWYGAENVTISNNIFAEALKSSIHEKGDHSMGMVVGDGASQVTIVNNLFAHNEFRNALIKDDASEIEIINNLVYNWGDRALRAVEGTTAHIIGNVYVEGPDTNGRAAINLEQPQATSGYYLEDNVGDIAGDAQDKIQSSYVFTPSGVDVMSSSEVFDYVLSHAGARYPSLTDTDARIIDSVREGTGGIIDSPDDVGGYDNVTNVTPPTDSDDDGIPDSVETVLGSDPNTFDAHHDADGNGVSNIEDYINGLVDGYANGQTGGTPDNESETTEPEPPAVDAPDPVTPVRSGRIEAEAFTDLDGFKVSNLENASGSRVVQIKGQDNGKASTVFGGDSGTYDLVVGYFDENDGVSKLTVEVNGKAVDSWDLDSTSGDRTANNQSFVEREIKNLQISEGDEISFVGTRDNKEPLRIDYVDFVSTGVSGEDNGALQPETTLPGDGDQPTYKIEAETLILNESMRVQSLDIASGDKVIQATGDGFARAATTFDGKSGTYDIAIDYFDEADGESVLNVLVGGELVDTWVWDAETEQELASPENYSRHVIEDVRIDSGDAIVLSGYADGGEPLRIDAVELFADMMIA